MSYNYLTEVPVNNNTVHTIRSLSLDHPDNLFIRGFKLEADIHELEDLLNEVIIRFDTNPDNYLKDDYMHLIALLYKNFLVVNGFHDRLDGVDKLLQDLEIRITKNEGDISDLDIRVTKNESDINNLDVRITKNEGDIITINNTINDLDAKVDNINTTINNRIGSEVTTINNTIDDLDSKVSNTNDTINYRIDNEVTKINDRIDSEVTDINTLIDNEVNNILSLLGGNSSQSNILITYNNLLTKVNNKELYPGLYYLITDYVFTTTLDATTSAEHPFLIVVLAISTDTLDTEAKAIMCEGDTYFAASKLYLWELRYDIHNDKQLYNWADDVNGKGVIYYMKDEFGNEAGYDFKNALFGKQLYVNRPYYEDGVYVDLSGKNYYTFDYVLDRDNADLSLTGSFVDCKIKFSKELPYNKFCNKGTNIIVEGGLNYIDDGINFVINGTLNYIDTSINITLNSDYTVVTSSLNISTLKSSLENIIIHCHDVKLGFENNANYLRNCLYFTTDSVVSSLNISNWDYCKIGAYSDNIISKDITLEYSTIGYNNYNVTFIGTGTFKNKTIGPSTFNTSLQEPNYEFEFNKDTAEESETIEKRHYITYIN